MASITEDATSKPGTTLSKASLYAPLVAYNHDDPALFVRTKKPSTSTQESSLYEFLGRVSTDYHRKGSLETSKNSANRPSSVKELKDKLQTRALTLVKGGINVRTSTRTNASEPKQHQPSSRQRYKRKEEMKLLNEMSPVIKKRQYVFLEQLHHVWLSHARRLVSRTVPADAAEDFHTISQRLQKVAPQMEWIGARVRIHACSEHPNWQQRQGILVASTTQMWKIIDATRSGSSEDERIRFQVFIVPKKGSVLVVQFLADTVNNGAGSGPENKDRLVYITLSDHKANR